MSTVRKHEFISIDDYLSGELVAHDKHEYVAGLVYAMVGGTNVHNSIASRVLIQLGSQLKGKRCQALNSDSKIRIRQSHHTRFYYPDVSVVCRPNPQQDTFHDEPVVVVEVLSRGTRRIDEGEKREAYLSIPSLTTYILLEQDSAAATVYRRSENGFEQQVYSGLSETIAVPDIQAQLSFAAVYEGIEFIPEPAEEP